MAPANVMAESALDTVPKLLLHNAKRYGSRPAFREKAFGIWQTWTWSQTKEEVEAFAVGLQQLGVKAGDTIAIIGDNRPHLYWAFCAAQSIGAIPVPVYQDSVAEEMAYVLSHAEVKYAIVEDQEQADKVLSVAAEVGSIRKIIYNDGRGLQKYDPEDLVSIESVQAAGSKALKSNPEVGKAWLAGVAAGKGSDVSVVLYTSGTTGRPKGVMLTQANVVVSGRNANLFDHFTPDDTMIAYLPMAWVGDHIFSYGQAFAGALCVSCPESPDTAIDARSVRPTFSRRPACSRTCSRRSWCAWRTRAASRSGCSIIS